MLSRFFKTLVVILFCISNATVTSQTTKEIEREWVSFEQEITVETPEKID